MTLDLPYSSPPVYYRMSVLRLQIGWSVIWAYIRSAGIGVFLLAVFGHGLYIASQSMANIWLCYWTDDECMPAHWNVNHTLTKGDKLAIYGGLGAVEGKNK